MTVSRTPREAVEHLRATGQQDLAEVLAGLLDRPREQDRRAAARRSHFDPDTVAYLDGLDRRRDAARRLPPLCPVAEHEHAWSCRDPQMAAAG